MKIQTKSQKSFSTLTFMALVALITAIAPFAVTSQAQAQTVAEYCKKFTVTSEKLACTDGWAGKACDGWLETHNEAHETICLEAAVAEEKATNTPTTPTTPTTPDEKTKEQKEKEAREALESFAERQERESKEPKKNPNQVPDNKYGEYVNGKGDYQRIGVNQAGDGAPAIIYIHGGGWRVNDGAAEKLQPSATARGYAFFSLTYRLGPSGVYYQLDDVMRGIRHVINNAGMYKIDPSRVAIWGDSAGGSLTVRAAGTGKSGAKAAIGWSAPTNGYTALFRSYKSFAIGMDHSTCFPTDVEGISDVVKQINGEASTDDGTRSSVYETGVQPENLKTVVGVLELANQASDTAVSAGEIAKKLQDENGKKELSENVRRLAADKFLTCMDNISSVSPALNASPLTPPMLLVGYQDDELVGPDQAYQMRDKLRSMGTRSDALILPGNFHLDYREEVVKPSLDWLDQLLQP